MDEEQLYLIEVLVDTIQFNPGILEVSNVNNVSVKVRFGNFATLDIAQENPAYGPPNLNRFIKKLDMGKSYLFPSKSKELIESLQSIPLELEVQDSTSVPEELIGVASLPWTTNFIEMIQMSQTNGKHATPASRETKCDVVNNCNTVNAEITIFVRLSCFGDSIQTQFQVVERKGVDGYPHTKRYLFKSSNAETTFQAQKYSQEGPADVVPIAPIFNPADPKMWQKPRGPLKPADLSAEMLKEVLCTNPDCPGAKKFKEFGLGPAATGGGLGTLYNIPDVPISYGLSHTYGALENYGPYGVYSRPKTLDQPFIPKRDLSCDTTPACAGGCCGNCPNCRSEEDHLRLYGGADIHEPSRSEENPLRLNGGAPNEDKKCHRPPAPMAMCKDLMNSFDKVLSAYKTALGPCGQAACPFAQNIAEETCNTHCSPNPDMRMDNHMKTDSTLVSACGTPGCPFGRQKTTPTDDQFQLSQMRSACGSPQCPFAKNKLDNITDEEIIEFQLMDGPALSRLCGAEKCPFPLPPCLPPLEPIHWDCPDPLPKGACRNPQCPLKPKQLRYNVPKGPCGSDKCPYATPPTCGVPNCPFGSPQSCPYQEEELSNDMCDNPQRRYTKPAAAALTGPICPNPRCPHATPPCPPPSMNYPCPPSQSSSPQNEICPNPNCPYAKKSRKSAIDCTNPKCPYKESEDNASLCDNPNCPYAKQSGGADDTCDNPDCPYVVAKKPSPCFAPPRQSVCDNPACPFTKKPHQPPPPCAVPVCDFPNCPFNPNSRQVSSRCPPVTCESDISICSIPNCPFSKKGQPTVTGDAGGGFDGSSKDPCTVDTCAALGGTQPNDDSQETEVVKDSRSAPTLSSKGGRNLGRGTASEKAIKSKAGGEAGEKPKRKRCRGKYKYKLGDLYPGNHIGHRECIMPGHAVPSKMGWLWNVWTPCVGLRPRMGWRPGAVDRVIANRIIAHRKSKGLQLVEGLKGKESKRTIKSKKSNYESDSDATVAPKSTLQIKKRDGSYFITMNPLKDPTTYEDNENPYMDCTPMQFKITKNKEKKTDENGQCFCDNDESSSDSELDIEFTPPAGVIRPERLKKKKNLVHTDTQYSVDDFKPKEDKSKKGGKEEVVVEANGKKKKK